MERAFRGGGGAAPVCASIALRIPAMLATAIASMATKSAELIRPALSFFAANFSLPSTLARFNKRESTTSLT